MSKEKNEYDDSRNQGDYGKESGYTNVSHESERAFNVYISEGGSDDTFIDRVEQDVEESYKE